ncbi:hypothetical protein COB55_03275 [Candidatus Wolfebacteria bacterium]|nr:MAG: hypothetical protein COB55_03275 [Candidatus Wolfebacteria bacterium]
MADPSQQGWTMFEWAMTTLGPLGAILWGYAVLKMKEKWQADDAKLEKKMKKDSETCKVETLDLVKSIITNTAGRLDKKFDANKSEITLELENHNKQIQENEKRDANHETENRADFKELHKRINDANERSDSKFEKLMDKMTKSSETVILSLSDIKADVAGLKGRVEK